MVANIEHPPPPSPTPFSKSLDPPLKPYFLLLFKINLSIHRSSPPEMFLGKGVLKICSKCTGEQTCRSAISIKLAASEFKEI